MAVQGLKSGGVNSAVAKDSSSATRETHTKCVQKQGSDSLNDREHAVWLKRVAGRSDYMTPAAGHHQ